jgi:RNA polymerase sigma factor (sigma-70 family)
MLEVTDEQLMLQVKKHDISAFEKLLDRYEHRIFGFFWRMNNDIEQARDCTQETFFRLWKARHRYKPKGKFSTYLFQIAKNHLLDEQQKQLFRKKTEQHYAESQVFSVQQQSSIDAYNGMVVEELQIIIRQAVQLLPDIQKLVLVLSEYQDMSYKEIGQIIGCSAATIYSRKAEAIEQLQVMLESANKEFFGARLELKEKTQ